MQLLARSIPVIAAFIVAACASVQQTENVGPNDPSAIAAIRAAYMKAAQQKSFRAHLSTQSEGKVSEGTAEYAAPGRMHMVMTTDGKSMEHIVVDGAHYIKSDGKWARLPIASADLLAQLRKDPEALAAFERTVSGAQLVGTEQVEGQRATAYRYYQAAKIAGGLASSAGWVKLWVGANGLPVKAESDATASVLGFGNRGKSTIVYRDYGANVRIVAPM